MYSILFWFVTIISLPPGFSSTTYKNTQNDQIKNLNLEVECSEKQKLKWFHWFAMHLEELSGVCRSRYSIVFIVQRDSYIRCIAVSGD